MKTSLKNKIIIGVLVLLSVISFLIYKTTLAGKAEHTRIDITQPRRVHDPQLVCQTGFLSSCARKITVVNERVYFLIEKEGVLVPSWVTIEKRPWLDDSTLTTNVSFVESSDSYLIRRTEGWSINDVWYEFYLPKEDINNLY